MCVCVCVCARTLHLHLCIVMRFNVIRRYLIRNSNRRVYITQMYHIQHKMIVLGSCGRRACHVHKRIRAYELIRVFYIRTITPPLPGGLMQNTVFLKLVCAYSCSHASHPLKRALLYFANTRKFTASATCPCYSCHTRAFAVQFRALFETFSIVCSHISQNTFITQS